MENKCYVIELMKIGQSSEHLRWLSALDRAGFFQGQKSEETCGRVFTEKEVNEADELFFRTRCCDELDLIEHSDGNHYCLFHLPTYSKDVASFENAFRKKFIEIEKQISAIPYFGEKEQKMLLIEYSFDFRHYFFPTYLSFSRQTFIAPVNFSSANFKSYLGFENCRFMDKLDFSQAEFEGYFKITDCTFNDSFSSQSATFHKDLTILHSTFKKDANFANLWIYSDIDSENVLKRSFENLSCGGDTSFSGILSSSPIDFKNLTFSANADFSDLTFENQTFENLTFEKDAIFKNSKFYSDIDLGNFKFKGKVDFSDVEFDKHYQRWDDLTFSDEVNFSGAKFKLGLIVNDCNFKGFTKFDNTEFDSTTQFLKSSFQDDASFQSTKFNWHTYFEDCEFSENVTFAADFAKQTKFKSCIFGGETHFGKEQIKTNFNGDTFFESVKFYDKTDFAGANFNHPTIIFSEVDFSNIINLPQTAKGNQKIMTRADLIIHNCGQLVTCASNGKAKKGKEMQELGIIQNGAIAVEFGKIQAVGTTAEILENYMCDNPENVIDAGGKVVMPAFVDPHTHIIYGGNRLDEFELKIKGADYLEILANGGGILSTVKRTRESSYDELFKATYKRLDKMLAHGTTTAEIKTGYGLDYETEMKMIEVWESLDERHPMHLVPTFLPAHAIPPEFKNNPDGYVVLICETMIPNLRNWKLNFYADPDRLDFQEKIDRTFFVDVFCEKNAFDLEQTRRILTVAKENGFALKAHVDEFTNLGGSKMCIEVGAVSIDHLDAISDEEIELLAKSKTVGIVTPTVNFNFGSAHFADARKLIDSGCSIAVSTDYNPGSAPCPSQQTAMQIACRYQKILPSEAINGTTINAAFSIALGDKTGSIEVGKWADILILDTEDYREVCYEFGGNFVKKVIKNGKVVVEN
ncbi:MAG TPA: imidazolonepropionase [Pyrinomonadaceae bacterium]|nr:imidazolonepropionase [Pyrinomonadaceae bacterium]